jgi:hypothetical protein
MEKIIRGSGFTVSERYLHQLSDRTFLKLWTYPNIFNDRNKAPRGDGKELCDLLVICGDDILIFSDKAIEWPDCDTLKLQWSRWYRRAIKNSVDQIRGAERWLRDYPDRIFLDSKCTRRLPIELPPTERRRVHGIAIVRGAYEACSRFFEGAEGSLTICSHIKGENHTDTTSQGWKPFAIGDVDPKGSFVHVFDETALDRVMSDMDTITDFIDYLHARATAIRNEDLALCPGESELLAYYMQTENPDDRPCFLKAVAKASGCDQVALWPGAYEDFVASAAYARKKKADAVSYLWDELVGQFVKHIMAGSSVSIFGDEPSASRAEPALRIMAREGRLRRRVLADGLAEVLRQASGRRENRYARIIMPGLNNGGGDSELAYVFMTLAHPESEMLEPDYRQVRASMLETYCYAVLQDNRRIKRVVGVAMDKPCGLQETSEDLLALEGVGARTYESPRPPHSMRAVRLDAPKRAWRSWSCGSARRQRGRPRPAGRSWCGRGASGRSGACGGRWRSR